MRVTCGDGREEQALFSPRLASTLGQGPRRVAASAHPTDCACSLAARCWPCTVGEHNVPRAHRAERPEAEGESESESESAHAGGA